MRTPPPPERCLGRELYWTKERCVEALRAYRRSTSGPLPTSRKAYRGLQGMGLPEDRRILDYWPSFVAAWRASGANKSRIPVPPRWTPEESAYLLEHVGDEAVCEIARHLGRPPEAVGRRLRQMGIHDRANVTAGYLTAGEVATEYRCPEERVLRFCRDGVLRAHKMPGAHFWRIDPADAEQIRSLLTAPRRTWKAG